MKAISVHYVLVDKVDEEKKEGFNIVEIQDSFTFKGKVVRIPQCPTYVDNELVAIGDVVLFAKYSPDTQEIEFEGKKMKMIKVNDILAIL